MNSKFLLIGSLSVLTVIGLFFASVSTDEVTPSKMNTDIVLIPTVQEFLKMDCEELEHIFPEFPSVKVADAWNTRMHECINEGKSLLLQTELEKWNGISCFEILNNPKIEFEDSIDKRAFDVRWKQCIENEM